LQLANDFSIQLCQLKMRIIFDGQRGGSPSSHTNIMQTFFRGIASDFKQKAAIWSDLVSVLDEDCARQIRAHAEELFLQSMTFSIPLEVNENNEYLARALLAVIEATSNTNIVTSTGNGSLISAELVEKLNSLVQYIMPQHEESDSPKGGEIISAKDLIKELRNW
jgi:mediator of RNA polymerase II transcription subunit 12